MVVDLQELAQRMLADYDAGTPGQLFGEPPGLTTVQAYALQAEIAGLREQRGEKSSATRSAARAGPSQCGGVVDDVWPVRIPALVSCSGGSARPVSFARPGDPDRFTLKLYPVAPGSRVLVEAPPLGKSCVEIDP
jgi:hypothetical protein